MTPCHHPCLSLICIPALSNFPISAFFLPALWTTYSFRMVGPPMYF
jgi:hypothetical protein